jgi:adenylate cyclase class 2
MFPALPGIFFPACQLPVREEILKQEIEVKIAVSQSNWNSVLADLGFRLVSSRKLESNVVLDFPGQELFQTGKMLRLRSYANKTIITFKGPAREHEKYKIRPESELEVQEADKMLQVFKGIGLEVFFEYEKFRTVYQRGDLELMLDETPIGVFLELEGEPSLIDRAASELGFTSRDFIRKTYYELFREISAQKRMVFR